MPRLLVLLPILCAMVGCDRRVQVGEVPTEREANRILDVLYSAGLHDARKERTRSGKEVLWVISLPSDHAPSAIQVLNDHGLPGAPPRGMRELLNDGGLIPSPVDEHIRLEYGKAGELEQLISNFEGVLSVSVELALPPPNATTRGPGPAPTCAITIRYRRQDDDAEWESRAGEVRRLAAHSIPGLSESAVAIALSAVTPREALSPRATHGSAAGSGQPAARHAVLILGGSTLLMGTGVIGLLGVEWRRRGARPRAAAPHA